jgi:FkbM family methyltransferase
MLASKDYSQNGQTQFILSFFKHRRSGVFVDCGVLDGIRHSNTYVLEHDFGWSGLLIEASPSFFNMAIANRSNRNRYINKAIYSHSGLTLSFSEIDWSASPGLSGLSLLLSKSKRHMKRINSEVSEASIRAYQVTTITLDDAMNGSGIQPAFEFLKIDIEGGEIPALQGLNLLHWKPQLISVEINYTKDLSHITNLLKESGYYTIKTIGTDFFFTRYPNLFMETEIGFRLANAYLSLLLTGKQVGRQARAVLAGMSPKW